MASELASILYGAIGASAVFLLGYVAKHWLDRTILPKILDFIASRSKISSLKRANNLVKKFQKEKKVGQIGRISRKLTNLGLLSQVVSAKILVALFLTSAVIMDGKLHLFDSNFKVHTFLALCLLVIFIQELQIMYSMIMSDLAFNMQSYTYGTAIRIISLLRAANLDDDEIHEWLKKDEDIRKLAILVKLYKNTATTCEKD
jgi:hypothetical protein